MCLCSYVSRSQMRSPMRSQVRSRMRSRTSKGPMIDFKSTAKLANLNVNLNKVDLITPSHPAIFQDLLIEYKKVDVNSTPFHRAALTLACSILSQERIYFGLSRKIMESLVAKDLNLIDRSFFNKERWPALLATLYNDFKLIELVQTGTSKRVSIYKVVAPEFINYLAPLVNADEQLKQCLEFIKPKESQKKP